MFLKAILSLLILVFGSACYGQYEEVPERVNPEAVGETMIAPPEITERHGLRQRIQKAFPHFVVTYDYVTPIKGSGVIPALISGSEELELTKGQEREIGRVWNEVCKQVPEYYSYLNRYIAEEREDKDKTFKPLKVMLSNAEKKISEIVLPHQKSELARSVIRRYGLVRLINSDWFKGEADWEPLQDARFKKSAENLASKFEAAERKLKKQVVDQMYSLLTAKQKELIGTSEDLAVVMKERDFSEIVRALRFAADGNSLETESRDSFEKRHKKTDDKLLFSVPEKKRSSLSGT